MKITVDTWTAKREFEKFGRDYFSYDGIDSILGYYDEIDENMEFDVIAICGDCTEYGSHGVICSFSDLISDYGYLLDCGGYTSAQWDSLTDNEQAIAIQELAEALENETTVLYPDNGNIIVFAF